MRDERQKDADWLLRKNSDGNFSWDQVNIAVLMDLRDELKAINRKLDCYRVRSALDAMSEFGVKLRREKRLRRQKRRTR